MIARARMSNRLFVDCTFHHLINYVQLLIILFKDSIISQYPCFYILMPNKKEALYDFLFKSIIRILSQNNIYKISYQEITTDTK